jgi:general secretion pathway protein G
MSDFLKMAFMAGTRLLMKLFIKTGNRAGFSLVELIVVVGIIAALVGLATPYYGDYVNESKHSVMRANLHTLEKALMDYRSDKGDYPVTNDVGILVSGTPRYLSEFPIDPTNDAPASWGYAYTAGTGKYNLDVRYDAYRRP